MTMNYRLTALLGCLALASCNSPAETMPSSTAVKPLLLLDAEGSRRNVLAAAEGRLNAFLFSRTDCPISNRYAPQVIQLVEEFRERVHFSLVYVEPRLTPEAMRAHLQEYAYNCSAVLDAEHQLVELTGATVTPEAALFDPHGKLLYCGRIDDLYASFGKARPAATSRDFRNALVAALEGEPVPAATGPAVGCYISDLK